MKMKKLSLIIIGLFVGIMLRAQVPNFPYPFKPQTDADYENVQSQAVDCMKWFINTPISKYSDSFVSVYNFLLIWTAGVKTIPLTFDIGTAAPLLEEKNEQNGSYYITAYISGMVLYQIQHPTQNDPAALQLEGIRAVIKFYENNSDQLEPSKAINKYRELNNNGKLDSWVGENLTRN